MQLNAPESKIGDFLSAHGGPFYEVQLRFRMLEEHSLHAFRRAVVGDQRADLQERGHPVCGQ